MLDQYKTKGTSILNIQKYLVSKLGKDTYHRIASEVDLPIKVMSSSWINIEMHYEMHKLGAKELGISPNELGKRIGVYGLVEDLNGVYKLFMRTAGVLSVLEKTPRMMKTYSNYSTGEILENTVGFYKIKYLFPKDFKSHIDLLNFLLDCYAGAMEGILQVCKYQLDSFKIVESNFDNSSDQDCYCIVEAKYSK